MSAVLLLGLLTLGPTHLDALPVANKDAKAKPAKEGPTQLLFEVEPAEVDIYLDGKKLGKAGKVKTVKVSPGKHVVRLVWNTDETEDQYDAKRGVTTTVKYKFEDSGKPTPPPAADEGKKTDKDSDKGKQKPAGEEPSDEESDDEP